MNEANDSETSVFPYTEGSVWSVQLSRTQPGTTKAYLRALRSEWRPVMEEAKRRRYILDYRILLTDLGHSDDWDVMIMVEVENMGGLDGHHDRMHRLWQELRGGSAGCASLLDMQGRPPDLVASKLLREINLK